MEKLLKDFFITFIIGVAGILLMYWIGYVPPNPRIFNVVDKITVTHFFENRIYGQLAHDCIFICPCCHCV